jgi:hypothetical protein
MRLDDPTELSALAFNQLEMDLLFAVVSNAIVTTKKIDSEEVNWATPHLEQIKDRLKRAP